MFEEKYGDLKGQDEYIFGEIFVNNFYNTQEDEIEGKYVVDVGANIGFFTLFVSNFKPADILCIEPDKDNFEKLVANLNKYKVVPKVVNKALSNETCKVLFIDGKGGLARTTTVDTGRAVLTDTLSNVVEQNFGWDKKLVLKVDCEGGEYDILLGLPLEKLRCFENIYIEVHNEERIEKLNTFLKDYIEDAGFECKWTMEFFLREKGKKVVHPNKVYKFKRKDGHCDVLSRNWYGEYKKILDEQENKAVTCVVCTKDRYHTTLPLTLMAICNQTLKPRKLLVFDDSENGKDLRGDDVYRHIFSLLEFYGVLYEVVWGEKKGQVLNHIKSLGMAKTELIWRVDDDGYPEPDVLEKLVKHMGPHVGAVGGVVIDPSAISCTPDLASNAIEDIYLGKNEQWFLPKEGAKVKEVDHLYSSFLYRKSVAEYCEELSPVGHREETMMTHEMKRKGYSLLFDSSARSWHFRNPQGGIRSYDDQKMFLQDEGIFARKMMNWGVRPSDYAWVVLDCGIGDHYAFKNCLPEYFARYKDKKHVFFVCFPEVFKDVDVKLSSIAEAKGQLGDIDRFNLYKWMIDNRWDTSLSGAFRKLYKIPQREEKKLVSCGSGDTIIISPYSHSKDHPKSYPYWDKLVPLIKALGFKTIQIGRSNEDRIEGVDECCFDKPFKDLENMVSECRLWLSADNLLPHMINCMNDIIQGVVLWGISDPKIFGYSYNENILKSNNFLRPNQFADWNIKRNDFAFCDEKVVFERIKKLLGK